ncbi:3-phosphoserine/phosphohydroxythreonine transaminase [soil metagenome]
MRNVFNFNAGPGMLPEEVLKQVQTDLLDWQGTGISLLEMGHRSTEFEAIAKQAELDLRKLLSIPENYKVLFLSGGATSQFAMVPLNLLHGRDNADYIVTGIWSEKAVAEAKRFCRVNIAATTTKTPLVTIPPQDQWQLNPQAAYCHYTPNETINGIEFDWVPNTGEIALVADMSSNILSRPIDVSRFGLIYAGAQKNMGPAGVTVVIVREDLVPTEIKNAPSMFEYKNHVKEHSLFNTPPVFNWYVAGLVFAWVRRQGGVTIMGERNRVKAAKLYQVIDELDFYHNPIDLSCRSQMNVVFTLKEPQLESQFLQQAEQRGLVNLKGHRSVGGMRASIYNAMPEAGIDTLVTFMREFANNV